MNNDPGDPFHHTTGFHSDQHGSAEASSDFGGLSSLFDQYYDYMGDFGENGNAIQHGGAEGALNLDSYAVQGLHSNSHFQPNPNNSSNGIDYNYLSYNQPHTHTPQFPGSRVPNQVQHSVDVLGRQNRLHQPNGAENAPDSTRSQTNLESRPKALPNASLVQPGRHSAYSSSNSQAGSAAFTSLSKYSNIAQLSCGATPNRPLQPITNLNSRHHSVPTPSPNPADPPLRTVPPQDYLHTSNPNILTHRPPPQPHLLQHNPSSVVAGRPSQFNSATLGSPSTDNPTFPSQNQSLSVSMGRPSSRNASAATNAKEGQLPNQHDERSRQSTSIRSSPRRLKTSSGPKKRKSAHKKKQKQKQKQRSKRFPTPLNSDGDEDLDDSSSDSETSGDSGDDSDTDSNGTKSDDRNSEEENDDQEKGDEGEGSGAQEDGQPTYPKLYVGEGEDLKIRERHRRGNPFLRSKPGGSTLFKQRTSVANRKYFGILDKQGQLTREQVAAIVKNYEGKTFSALDHSETIIWDNLASMIGLGHANFIFIEPSKRPTLAKDLLLESQSHIYNAFKFPSFSLVFPPTEIGGTVNYAVTDYGKDGPPNFLVWMKANCPDVLEAFTKQCGLYTQAIWNPTQEAQAGVEKARKIANKKQKKNNPDAWLANYVDETQDGIRIWKDAILEITVEMARRVFHASMLDRFKRNGWPLGKGEVMYWNVIGGPHRDEIIRAYLLPKVETDDGPREAGLASYSNLKKPDMAVWMKFLLDHQDGTIGWEDGMLFKDVRNDSPHTAKRRRMWFKKLVSSARNESGPQPTFDEEVAAREEILNLLEEDARRDDVEHPQSQKRASPAESLVMMDPPNSPRPNASPIGNPSNHVDPTDPQDPIPQTAPTKKARGRQNASKKPPKKSAPSVEEQSLDEPGISNDSPSAITPTGPADPTNPPNPPPDPTGTTVRQKQGRGRAKGAQAPPAKEKQQQKEVAAAAVGAAADVVGAAAAAVGAAAATATSSTSKGQNRGKKSGKENETPTQEQPSLDVGGHKLRNRPDTTTTKGLKRKGSQLESEKTKVPRTNAKNGRKTK